MPALVQSMHDLLDGWMEEQGCPFLYDGRDYKASMERSPLIMEYSRLGLAHPMTDFLAGHRDTGRNLAVHYRS